MKKQMLSLFLALALTGCAAPGPGSTSAPAESGAAPAGSEAPASASQEESGYDRREAIERPEIGAEVVIDPPYDFDLPFVSNGMLHLERKFLRNLWRLPKLCKMTEEKTKHAKK